jgi:hypothetical protein
MSADQEVINLAGAESESQTLFDELAGLVPWMSASIHMISARGISTKSAPLWLRG